MLKKPALRCSDCKQFNWRMGRCAWGIKECEETGGHKSIHADDCNLFTNHNGYAPLLDCKEEQLPAWYRQKELFKTESPTMQSEHSTPFLVKKKPRKKKRKQKPNQLPLESLSTNKI